MYAELGNTAVKEATYPYREEMDALAGQAQLSAKEEGRVSELLTVLGLETSGDVRLDAARVSACKTFATLSSEEVTRVNFPDDIKIPEAFLTVTLKDGVWDNHSDESPSWVVSDSAGLESLLAEHFACPAGYPKEVI